MILQKKAMTLSEARKLPLDLVLNLKNGFANGEFIFDDGETVNSEFVKIKLFVENNQLKITCEASAESERLEAKLKRNFNLEKITVTGSYSDQQNKLRFRPDSFLLNKNLLQLTNFCKTEFKINL